MTIFWLILFLGIIRGEEDHIHPIGESNEPSPAYEYQENAKSNQKSEESLNHEDHNDDTMLLYQEWEEHMKDFVPEDMITFEISPRDTEEFYSEIDITPSHIRGA